MKILSSKQKDCYSKIITMEQPEKLSEWEVDSDCQFGVYTMHYMSNQPTED